MLIILDRDGVINEDRPDSVRSITEFRFIEGSKEAIAQLTQAGHTLVIATNQSVVGKGIITQDELDAIHAHMLHAIEQAGGKIMRIYVATDRPDAPSGRRKPAPGMLLEAMRDLSYSPAASIMIGDAMRDLDAARAAGIGMILVETGKGAQTQKALPVSMQDIPFVANLASAAQLILATSDKAG